MQSLVSRLFCTTGRGGCTAQLVQRGGSLALELKTCPVAPLHYLARGAPIFGHARSRRNAQICCAAAVLPPRKQRAQRLAQHSALEGMKTNREHE